MVPAERRDAVALERAVSALRTVLSAIHGIPRVLFLVLWASVASGVGLAWLWFLRRDLAVLRWAAVPWLAAIAVPQLGLWLLASSLRELFTLPERLLALKSDLADQGDFVLRRIRRVEAENVGRAAFLVKLREAYALYGDLSRVVATRALLQRFTGSLALIIGPISFVLNCGIILIGLVQLVIVAI